MNGRLINGLFIQLINFIRRLNQTDSSLIISNHLQECYTNKIPCRMESALCKMIWHLWQNILNDSERLSDWQPGTPQYSIMSRLYFCPSQQGNRNKKYLCFNVPYEASALLPIVFHRSLSITQPRAASLQQLHFTLKML